MKVKKYIAPSMPEAMKKIRSELGSEAVILNSKVVHTPGFLGLFRKKNFEVIAAVDPVAPTNQRLQSKEKSRKEPVAGNNQSQNNGSRETVMKQVGNQPADPNLIREIQELKSMLGTITTDTNPYSGPIKEMNRLLTEQEVSPSYRQEVLTFLLEKWYTNQGNASFEEVLRWTKNGIQSKIESLDFGAINYQKKFVNVVGPTGVGKTTTLAKIAAECILKDHKKVAFITTDTYRIAAIDQLKTYAKILGAPIEVCYSVDDFKKAKVKYEHYDVVLIDTAGRNFRNPKYVEDLQKIIDFNDELETLLVLSLTAKMTDMKAIYDQFSLVKIDKFIFTKADETSNYGPMLNLILHSGVGVAYLTNGQNVPDDIVVANPTLIANTLLGVDE